MSNLSVVRMLLCVFLLVPNLSRASSGDAIILWDTFRFKTSPGITLTWSDQLSYVFAGSPAPPAKSALSAGSFDWTSTRQIQEDSGSASGFAESSGVLLHAQAQATSSCCENRSALGQAWREGIFTLSDTGSVTFEVDYQISVIGQNSADFTTAASSLFFVSDPHRADALLNSSNGTSNSSGTLTVVYENLGVGPGGDKFIAAATTVSTVTAVPEPETYAMMLAGLGLLGVVTKRRRRSFSAS